MSTIFSIFAFRGRYRDNPSLRTRSTANFEQRMEIAGGVHMHDHLCAEGQPRDGDLRDMRNGVFYKHGNSMKGGDCNGQMRWQERLQGRRQVRQVMFAL